MTMATDYGFSTRTDVKLPQTAAKAAGGDFDTFLKMLTTQISNQDPLNPMEGSDFAVQLATFSGVEQQTRTNQLLEALTGQMAAGGLSQVAGWIGREVRSAAPVWFGDEALTLDVRPDAEAEQVVLVAYDQFGRAIARDEIGPGQGQIDWLGRDDAGAKLPDGLYRFEIESLRGGEVTSVRAAESYARVTEARVEGGQAVLVLEGGGLVAADSVSALRDARG